MTYTGCEENTDVLLTDELMKLTQVYHTVHHLCDTETVSEVMERVVPIVLLDTQLQYIHTEYYSHNIEL